tara:strand:+ start:1598 stop:2458 length:861 start_codon:yes stop_codon:yes gene_type:complete
MIIWLASYPKSGNTWVRSFIATLLFNKSKNFDLKSLSNIPQFPLRSHFHNLVKDDEIDDLNKVSSYWIKSQQIINLDNKIKFFKTHHTLCKINGSIFTNYENSLGVIYIVRDPRNVVSSIKYHFSKDNYIEAKNFLLNENKLLGKKFDKTSQNKNRDMFTPIASWKTHYNSWKNFKKNFLLIKYENLVSNPYEEFIKISEFLSKLMNIEIPNDKIVMAIENNTFDNLKENERKNGFVEAAKDLKTGKTKSFFNLGPQNKWQEKLNVEIKQSIEEKFKIEMKELGYL